MELQSSSFPIKDKLTKDGRVVECTDTMRFVTHYVLDTKCPPETTYMKKANRTARNKVLRLMETRYGAYARGP